MLIRLTLLCCLFVCSRLSAAPVQFYVASGGDDTATGSQAAPFASIERARDEIRKLRESGNKDSVDVILRGGSYFLPNGLKFGPKDSGTETAPVAYKAFPNEKPILVGGRPVKNFVPYEGKILKADMKAEGIGNVYFRQLIFDGKRQHLARYPNFDPENPYGGGWAYAAGKRIPMYQNIDGETQNEFDVEEKDFRNWKKPDEMEVMVFARYNWWNNICPVKSIDPETKHVVLTRNASYPIRPGDRYYFRNAFEELDSPGEWYLDKETQTLYFQPPAPLEGKEVFVPTTRNILKLDKGTSDIVFRGLTFECSEGTAIEFNEASRCRIQACTVRNVGDYNGSGITINGGTKNIVYGCDIHDTGSHGIFLGGGDRKTLIPAEHVAENNYIHHVGVFYAQGVGVAVQGVGQRVAHNLVHDGPRMAFMFGGNNHVFEYNHIRHMNLETSDTGAFYTGGRDWITSRGSVIRYNFMHDILGYGKDRTEKWVSPYYAWGVYLDDNAGGVDVIGNIALRCPRAGVHLHNGRDNKIENNIFADCGLQQMECNGWNDTSRMWTDHYPTMVKGYESVVDEPAWKNMRNMKLHPKDAVLPDKTIMSGNEFVRNIVTYRDPESRYVRFNRFSFKHNVVDHNVVWAHGNPIATGVRVSGKVIGENVAPNPSFENGEVGKFPADWNWQVRPSNKSVIEIDESQAVDGKRSLRIDADFVKEKPRDNIPIACCKPIPLKPGATYKLSGTFKATQVDSPITFLVHYWAPNKPYWGSGLSDVKIGTDWTPLDHTLTIPKPGDSNWHDDMKSFRITIGFKGETGSVFADDIKLEEVETLDDWASWQANGMDVHSVVADPLFVGGKEKFEKPADFRLQPDSPALKLGFKQIPVEKIGPYENELRATWPIVEAEGAREKPLVGEKATE